MLPNATIVRSRGGGGEVASGERSCEFRVAESPTTKLFLSVSFYNTEFRWVYRREK
jgi:hypothetical protein